MERLVCMGIGYAFGLFQTSYIYGKLHKIDIREHGSGNAGSTNALRTMGKKAGALTLLGDCMKCVLAVLLARLLYGGSHAQLLPLLGLYAAFGCILGHNFPFYLGFKGGKGIAASVGMLLAVDIRLFPIAAAVFFGIFWMTHYVSLASLLSYTAALLAVTAFGAAGSYGMEPRVQTEMDLVMLAMTLLAFWQHRGNIGRLCRGTESKIYLNKTEKGKQVQ